jgi:hypothetical protein
MLGFFRAEEEIGFSRRHLCDWRRRRRRRRRKRKRTGGGKSTSLSVVRLSKEQKP